MKGLLCIYMGMSKDHTQFITHAHILLVGFVASFIYGVVHKLWLGENRSGLATTQFFLHHTAAIVMLCGLFLMFGKFASEETVGPILGIASIGVFLGMLLMLLMVVRTPNAKLAA